MTLRRAAMFVVAFAAGLVVADRMMTARSVAAEDATATTTTTTTATTTTAPATAPAASRPTIPADAQAIFDRITAAYAKRPLEVVGTFEQHFDVAGIVRDHSAKIRGVARSDSMFRHETDGQLLVVADGTKGHVLDQRAKVFRSDALASSSARPIVAMQNPALAVAIEGDAAKALLPNDASNVRALPASMIDGKSLVGIGFDVEGTNVDVRVPAEGEATIDRVAYDFASYLSANGAADVKRAVAISHYERSGAPEADANADARFAFTAPADAREATSATSASNRSSTALTKGEAPAFTLKDLDGKEVKLEADRGHVVVLDFWATWCGPCQASLPVLSSVAQQYAAKGVRVYAVNMEEQPDVVREFWAKEKLPGVRPILDTDGAVGGAYGVSGIPHTVIIDAKGQIRDVIVGFDPAEGKGILDKAIGAAVGGR